MLGGMAYTAVVRGVTMIGWGFIVPSHPRGYSASLRKPRHPFLKPDQGWGMNERAETLALPRQMRAVFSFKGVLQGIGVGDNDLPAAIF